MSDYSVQDTDKELILSSPDEESGVEEPLNTQLSFLPGDFAVVKIYGKTKAHFRLYVCQVKDYEEGGYICQFYKKQPFARKFAVTDEDSFMDEDEINLRSEPEKILGILNYLECPNDSEFDSYESDAYDSDIVYPSDDEDSAGFLGELGDSDDQMEIEDTQTDDYQPNESDLEEDRDDRILENDPQLKTRKKRCGVTTTHDTDADPDYLPSGNEDNSARDLFRNRPSTSGVVVEEQNNGPPAKRPKHEGKKKTRRPDQWKRKKGSIARNKGEGYTDRTGKNHQPKQVRDFNHNCRYECSDIPQEKRQEIFNEYWALGNWELQSAFLNSVILHHSPHQTRANNEHYNKSVSCQYFFVGKRVCKEFFLKTIDISNKRVMNIVKRKQLSGTSISPRDKRGKKIPPNKTNPEKLEFVKEHIMKFPRYTSHYSRQQNPNKKYLNPGLNVKKMYDFYKELCKEKAKEPLTLPYYRYVFNTKFNLSFHRPQTDTCATCDRLQQLDHLTKNRQLQYRKNSTYARQRVLKHN
ncbi:uncharacterized protein LOC124370420 [Homalodisca vitripennis]|uniref:uncharacterized protein LOC124370420 n=1 Tax=Homalodisca vitripennis TaxID=197043 RepID=UPI001EEB9978|nr:uncharacterized protein LOC124370420 [Homalodisca vitripennis]